MKKFSLFLVLFFLSANIFSSSEVPKISEGSSDEDLKEYLASMANSLERDFFFYFDVPTDGILKCVSADIQAIADVKDILASLKRRSRINSNEFTLSERKFSLQQNLFLWELGNLNILLTPPKTYDVREKSYFSKLNSETALPLEDHPRRHLITANFKLNYFPVSEELSPDLQKRASFWEKNLFNFLRSHSEFLNGAGKEKKLTNNKEAFLFLKEALDLMCVYMKFLCENWKLEEEPPKDKTFPSMSFSIQSQK